MWKNYLNTNTIDQAIQVLASQGKAARIVAGATDLILELERGVRTGIDTLVDITRIPGLSQIYQDGMGLIHIPPLATHNDCVASPEVVAGAFPLAQAAWLTLSKFPSSNYLDFSTDGRFLSTNEIDTVAGTSRLMPGSMPL